MIRTLLVGLMAMTTVACTTVACTTSTTPVAPSQQAASNPSTGVREAWVFSGTTPPLVIFVGSSSRDLCEVMRLKIDAEGGWKQMHHTSGTCRPVKIELP